MSQAENDEVYYSIHANVYTDDDFELEGGEDIKLQPFATEDDAGKAMIDRLLSTKTSWSKKWSIRRTAPDGTFLEERSGDYDCAWEAVRDLAIEQLQDGVHSFTVGGNQTIEVWVYRHNRLFESESQQALRRVSAEDRKTLRLPEPLDI